MIKNIDELNKAFYFHKKNHLDIAEKIYNYILSVNIDNFHAKHYLGLIYLQTGRTIEGRTLISEAIVEAGTYPEALHNLSVFGNPHYAKIEQEISSVDSLETIDKFTLDTVDSWRHWNMLDFVDVFDIHENETWLTIGDATGRDAQIITLKGVLHVTASNLDSNNLKIAKNLCLIDDFLEINAENITLDDLSQDYVVCKQALHHMPRPYLAIYEMLRVSKKAIFLVEPCDPLIDYIPPKESAIQRDFLIDTNSDTLVDSFIVYTSTSSHTGATINYKVHTDWYEDGPYNYVYTLSEREIKKICNGMGLPGYAVKKFNDLVMTEHNEASINSNNFNTFKEQVQLQDNFCSLSGKQPGYICCIIFKEIPDDSVRKNMISLGYKMVLTPTVFMPFKFVSSPKG